MHICTHIDSFVLKPHNIIFTYDKILIEIPCEFNMSTVDKLYVYVSAMSFTSPEMVAADQKGEASTAGPVKTGSFFSSSASVSDPSNPEGDTLFRLICARRSLWF